jgi:hypothetical protein
MIIITVGVDYPRLGSSLLALGILLVPFLSVSLGLGEEATWLDAVAPPLATTGCRSAGGCSCRRRGSKRADGGSRHALKGKRDRTILALFLLHAIRRAELCDLLLHIFQRFEKYGLKLHSEKTRLLPCARLEMVGPDGEGPEEPGTFDFLGFTHYWGKSWKGHWLFKRKTVAKRLRRTLIAIGHWCRINRHRGMFD